MRRELFVLVLLFASVAALRMYLALQAGVFTSDAYFVQGQVEAILEHGVPSYVGLGATPYVFLPFFHYMLAVATLVFPLHVVLAVIPNLFAASIVLVSYLIARHLTKREDAAIFAAFASGFVPVFMAKTFLSASVYTLSIPLFFLSLYGFMRIEEKRYLHIFLGGLFLLTLTHASSLLLVLVLLFYLGMLKMEGISIRRAEVEVVVFSSLLVLWVLFLVYKQLLLFSATLPVFGNAPAALVAERFLAFSPLDALYRIGVIPFLAGLYVVYRMVVQGRNKNVFLLASVAIVMLLLAWLQLIELVPSLMILGITLSILFGPFYQMFFTYLAKTKIAAGMRGIAMAFALFLIITSVFPSITLMQAEMNALPPESLLRAFSWIADNTPPDAVILAEPQFGHMITALAQRRNIIDANVLFARDAVQRHEDVQSIYRGISVTDGIRLLDKYGTDYVVSAEYRRPVAVPAYLETDRTCFRQVYYHAPFIYRPVCRVN